MDEWPISNDDLAKLLGVKSCTIRSHLRNHKKELIEGQHFTRGDLSVPNAPRPMYAWNKEGAIKVAHYCKRSP